MSGKQARRARALAFKEAQRRGLWGLGEKSLYGSLSWWQRLQARFSSKRRSQLSSLVGKWYKRTLKGWASLARSAIHDPEQRSFEVTRQKLARQRARERQQQAPYKLHLNHPSEESFE